MSAITAVTAQNSLTVNGVQFLSPAFVARQIDTVLSDYGAGAVKTGFLGQSGIIAAVAGSLRQHHPPFVIIDPVLVNHRQEAMFSGDVVQAYRDHLLPLADLITPNWAEAQLLAPQASNPETAVTYLHQLGVPHILITSIPDNHQRYDLYSDGQSRYTFLQSRLATDNTHGSGDTLSAAICAFLAQGQAMETAVAQARAFTWKAIQNGADWQLGSGHGPVWPSQT